MIHRPDLFYIQRVGTSNFLRIEFEWGHLSSNRCAIASKDCQKKVKIMRRYFWVAKGKCFVRSDQSLVNMPTLSPACKSDELFSKTPWRWSTNAWGNASRNSGFSICQPSRHHTSVLDIGHQPYRLVVICIVVVKSVGLEARDDHGGEEQWRLAQARRP